MAEAEKIYFSSNSIEMFPSGFRGNNFGKSKLTTEENLRSLLRISKNKENNNLFIIDPLNNEDTSDGGRNLILVIQGYIFKFNESSLVNLISQKLDTMDPDHTGGDIHVGIKVRDLENQVGLVLDNIHTSGYILDDILPDDSDYSFTGLCVGLEGTLEDIAPEYKIKIATQDTAHNSINLVLQEYQFNSDEIRDSASGIAINEEFNTSTIKVDNITKKSTEEGSILKIDKKIQTNEINGGTVEIGTESEVYLATDSKIILDHDENIPDCIEDWAMNRSSKVDIIASRPAFISSPLIVGGMGSDEDPHTSGSVIIKSKGSGKTIIIGPSNGTITLPPNSGSGDRLLYQYTDGNNKRQSGWISFSSSSDNSTVAQRTATGGINASNFNGLKLEDGVSNDDTALRISNTRTENSETYNRYIASDGALEVTEEGILKVGPKVKSGETTAANIFLGNPGTDNTAPSAVNITIAKDFEISAYSLSKIILKSMNSNPVTLTLTGNLHLPANSDKPQTGSSNKVWVQNWSSPNSTTPTNNWYNVTSIARSPNSIVMTDGNGNINAQVSGSIDSAAAVKQEIDDSNSSKYVLFTDATESPFISTPKYTTEFSVNPYTGDITAGKYNEITIKEGTSNNTIIDGPKKLDLYAPLIVGDAQHRNRVNIKSSATTENTANTSTIVIPDNKTIQLYEMPGSNTSCVLTGNGPTTAPIWRRYSSDVGSSNIVSRDTNGRSSFDNITLTGVTNANLATNANGEIVNKDLSVSNPTASSGNSTDFIATISQGSDGKIAATRKSIGAATSDNYGGIKTGYTTSGLYCAVQLDGNGRAYVKVPPATADTTYSINNTGTTLVWGATTKIATLQGSSGADSDITVTLPNQYSLPTATSSSLGGIRTGYTASGKNYAVKVDGSGNAYVNVPWSDNNTWTANAVNTAGYVSAPGSANANKVWKTDSSGNPGWRNDANTTYSTATSSTAGLIKVGYSTSGKNYAVNVDSGGNAYVNVPWSDTNTTYSAATTDTLGLVKIANKVNSSVSVSNTSTASRYYGVQMDSSSKLFVNVPWTDNNTTYSAGSNITISSTTVSLKSDISLTSVTASGNIKANTFTATSDIRLKENIKDWKPSKSILDLKIKEFDYKENKQHAIGCIAQDLQEICPEIVHEMPDGYLAIEESKLVYLLLDEVKKLKEEVSELKK